ncbi:MAG: hypothetical protein HQK96_10945 [Nitrospirae bacterium]|nr:hypothetical protein [Nitrospirota bacterium]
MSGIHNGIIAYYTTEGEKDTGLGLFMSKTIIEMNMAGSLEASNVEGRSL